MHNVSLWQRRIKAICSLAPDVYKKFADKFPDLDIGRWFAVASTMPISRVIDNTDSYNYITLACALFILDELNDSDCLGEALIYVEDDKMLTGEIEIPDGFIDSLYDNDVIKGMMYLIKHRNDNQKHKASQDTFFSAMSLKRANSEPEPVEFVAPLLNIKYEEQIAEYKQKMRHDLNQMSCRQKFDKVMSWCSRR